MTRPFDSARARAAGKASGKSRQRLNLARVEEAFGPLETIKDAMRRLDLLGRWVAAGMLSGSAGGAASRTVEVWLRAHESKLTEQVVTELRARLDELEGQLRQGRLGVVR